MFRKGECNGIVRSIRSQLFLAHCLLSMVIPCGGGKCHLS